MLIEKNTNKKNKSYKLEFCDYCKIALCSYVKIPQIIVGIDNIINKTALNYFLGTEEASKIIERHVSRKIELLNFQDAMRNALIHIDNNKAKLLLNHYVKGYTDEKTAHKIGCSIRTVYRKKSDAIKSFADALVLQRYSEEDVERIIKRERWMIYNASSSIYNTIINNDNNKELILDYGNNNKENNKEKTS